MSLPLPIITNLILSILNLSSLSEIISLFIKYFGPTKNYAGDMFFTIFMITSFLYSASA